jgi:L-lactate dehydrogenase (cytochrome)
MIIANIEHYRRQCEARLPRFLYDYISGGSFQENTLRANLAELQATLLRQRVMVDESHLTLSTHLWDQAMSLPVVLGPVGMAGMYSSRGEIKAAKAAKAVGVPFTLSTMGVCDVHEVSQKSGVAPWFQLDMLKDRGFVKSLIERSVSAGSKVLVFTVDLATPGRRYSEVHFDASTPWKDIEWVRSIFPGKIILKGILAPEDAERAVQTNIDGIVVSNHGGRQLDSVTSIIRALPKVVAAVQGKLPVFMDGGIRSGLDVLKALAPGAKACLIGRAWAYALGAAGEPGVRDMLNILKEELSVGMILTGCSDVNRASPDLLLEAPRLNWT